MAVKGSKIVPMKVIPHDPIARVFRFGVMGLAFFTLLYVSYFFGAYFTTEERTASSANQVKQYQDAAADLSRQITLLKTNSDVDRQTIEELRQLVVTQKAQLMASDRDLRVYKDLLSPMTKTNPLGISFGVFTVFPLKEVGKYSYSLTVQKLSTKEGEFAGNLEFKIVGKQNDKPARFLLNEVSSQVTSPNIPLSFKYFQTLEGELSLPADFVAQNVELVVYVGDRKNPPLVETQLDWPVSTSQTK